MALAFQSGVQADAHSMAVQAELKWNVLAHNVALARVGVGGLVRVHAWVHGAGGDAEGMRAIDCETIEGGFDCKGGSGGAHEDSMALAVAVRLHPTEIPEAIIVDP
jgi:hypothetical protein